MLSLLCILLGDYEVGLAYVYIVNAETRELQIIDTVTIRIETYSGDKDFLLI